MYLHEDCIRPNYKNSRTTVTHSRGLLSSEKLTEPFILPMKVYSMLPIRNPVLFNDTKCLKQSLGRGQNLESVAEAKILHAVFCSVL